MSQTTSAQRENKMGTMPVKRLLLSMSVPMMVSMLVQALYNMVDSVFVSWLSEDAMTAVSLTFPIQNLMIAVSVGTGVGINALLSRSLGEGNQEMANRAANVGVFLNLASSLLFTVMGLFFSRIFFTMQVDTPATIAYGQDYMFFICTFSFGMFGQVVFSRLLQSTGKTFYSMIVQIAGAIINLILDPLLIFGLFGFPALGVAGAAIATVIGQVIGMILAIILNIKCNPDIQLSFRMMKPSLFVVKRIYVVGIPSILMQTTASIMSFALNKILLSYTETAARVFGAYFKIQGFFFMPVFGLNNGIVPIVAYNYGAKKPDRIVQATKLCAVYATMIMAAGFLVFQIAPGPLLQLFNPSEEMLSLGTTALRFISPSFLMAGFVIVTSSVLQALGKGVNSMVISLVRQLVFLVPAAYLLSLSGNVNLIWLAFPISDLFATGLAILFLRKINRNIIMPLRQSQQERVPAP